MVYRFTATLSREQCCEDGSQDGSEKGNTNEMTHGLKGLKRVEPPKETDRVGLVRSSPGLLTLHRM